MGEAVDRDRILEGVKALKLDPEGSEMIWSGDVEAIIRYAPAVRGKRAGARVMTLEEYRAIAEKPREEREPVWEEWRGRRGRWKIPQRAYEGYGRDWICWTERPTEEQRGAVKWDG